MAPGQAALEEQGPPPTGCPSPLNALSSRARWPRPPPCHLPAFAERFLPSPPTGRTYPELKLQCRNLLMKEWEEATPDPARYEYRPSLKPHPFMGLSKFDAGRLHQMRSGKSYIRAHPSWDDSAPTTCPSCEEAQDIFEYAILHCSAKGPARIRHLQGISDIGTEALGWALAAPLCALTRLIRSTATAFPAGMFSRLCSSAGSFFSRSSNVVSFGYLLASQES